MERLTGTVDRLLGYHHGFIRRDEPHAERIYFHERQLARGLKFSDLRLGQRVTFTVGHDKSGRPAADEVQLLRRGADALP